MSPNAVHHRLLSALRNGMRTGVHNIVHTGVLARVRTRVWPCVVVAGIGTLPGWPPGTAHAQVASVATFELLGGWRLRSDFASEGLALVTDSQGFVVEAVAGAHAHQHALHVYDLRVPWVAGTEADAYPALDPLRTWTVAQLFPRWIDGQNLRDVAVVATPSGYELAGIGRVFYNTSPRPTTQINVRELQHAGRHA